MSSENTNLSANDRKSKPPMVVLTGPTAVGKTELSVRLAKELNGEIISADSMQVYRRMDIGTAKITHDEMCGVAHHLIDILEPSDEFNVYLFKQKAKSAADAILSRGRIPIVVGGTGFYIQSLLYDIDFAENGDDSIRRELTDLYSRHGAEYMHRLLKEVDPLSADAIHVNNVKRVIRAIEFYRQTGMSMAAHNAEQNVKTSPYNFAYFVLNDNRELVYERINRRIDVMLQNGLVGEVEALLKEGVGRECVSMQGLGYKEIAAYLDGEIPLEEAVYILKRDTRHFAKRQLTWFRRERDTVFVNLDELKSREAALGYMLKICREKEII